MWHGYRKKLARGVWAEHFRLDKMLEYVVDGSTRTSHSNAYFYGFFKNKRIVLYDTLLKQMNQEEILAILGHEIGHYKKNHIFITLGIVQIQLFVMLFLFGNMINNSELYRSFGFYDVKPTIIGFILFNMVYSPVEHVLGFFMNSLSRRNEFEADTYATKLGYPSQLKTGLIKIHKENKSTLVPDHLYCTYHYTHPPLMERLKGIDKSKNE